MHTLILAGSDGRALTPAATWADTRASKTAESFQKFYEDTGLYKDTGCSLSPAYPLYHLLWLKENDTKLFGRIDSIFSIKSFILNRLFSERIEDYSLAGATGMFNIHSLKWDNRIVARLGVELEKFPKPVPVSYEIKTDGGKFLPKNISSLIGSSDGVFAHMGSVGIKTERASITLGTSGAVRIFLPEPLFDEKSRIWSYPEERDIWISGLATGNCGNVIENFTLSEYKHRLEIHEINEILADTEFSPNLIYNPFLFGERIPFRANSAGSGSFFNLNTEHRKSHKLRSVIESIAFNLIDLLEILKSEREINEIVLSGNISKIELIQDIIRTIAKMDHVSLTDENASLRGAFSLYARKNNVDNIIENKNGPFSNEIVPKRKSTLPGEKYREKYGLWRVKCLL